MRKVLSIPLIILILGSGMTLNVATHYCGGVFAATRVSLSPRLASCGMEIPSVNKLTEDAISKHCCEDKISAYSFDTNYVPSTCFVLNPDLHVVHYEYVTNDYSTSHSRVRLFSEQIIRPPGTYNNAISLLQVICVFRI
jgi:hypothetical protein